MKERGEWGKMFDMKNVPSPYNNSSADFNMPLTREQAEKLGYRWADRKEPSVPDEKVLQPTDDIKDVSWVDIEGKFILCEETGRPFKIVKQELEFYQKYNIPLPRIHPWTRIRNRYPKRIFFNLHETYCTNCNKKIVTSMPPEDKLLCDECYRAKTI